MKEITYNCAIRRGFKNKPLTDYLNKHMMMWCKSSASWGGRSTLRIIDTKTKTLTYALVPLKKEINQLRRGVPVYAVQVMSQIDVDIAEKGHLWTENNYKICG